MRAKDTGKMNKEQIIREILGLQPHMSRAIAPYAVAFWKKLTVPLAQLKSLLIIAHRQNTNYKSLAQDLDVTPGDVTGIVERLVEQGLVTRIPNPDDRRITWLEITPEGQELLTNLTEVQSHHMEQILGGMQEEDMAALLQGSRAFIRAMEQHQQEVKEQE